MICSVLMGKTFQCTTLIHGADLMAGHDSHTAPGTTCFLDNFIITFLFKNNYRLYFFIHRNCNVVGCRWSGVGDLQPGPSAALLPRLPQSSPVV